MDASKANGWPRTITVGSVSVKVYEVNHATAKTGKAYVLAWHTPTGRKTQKFADPAKAVEEGRLIAAQLAHGRVEGADMTKGDRDELQAARQLAAGQPLLTALKEWAQARELTQGQVLAAAQAWKARHRAAIEQIKVSDLLAGFLKEKKKLGYATADNHGSIFDAVKAELGDFNIAQVSASMLSAYLGKIAHPVTRNTHRKRLVTLWRWAQSKNYLPRDTRTEAEQTDRAREQAPPVGIIPAPVFEALLAHIRAHQWEDLPALVIAGFAGLRRAEVHSQTWEDIDLARKFVRVTYAKKGTPARRLVPLSHAAVEWLMLSRTRKGPICQGLAIDRVRKTGIVKVFPLPDNCLRHSYISHHVAAIGNVAQAALDSGNSPQIIHRHYRELVTPDEGKAWFEVRPEKMGEMIQMRKATS